MGLCKNVKNIKNVIKSGQCFSFYYVFTVSVKRKTKEVIHISGTFGISVEDRSAVKRIPPFTAQLEDPTGLCSVHWT